MAQNLLNTGHNCDAAVVSKATMATIAHEANTVLRLEVTEALTMDSRSAAVTCEEPVKQSIPSGGFQGVLDPTDYCLFTDEALVDLTRAGNNAAFDELVGRYCPGIYGLALSVLKNENDAGDALCRAFLAARKDIHSIGDQCSPGTWLYLHGLRAVFKRLNPKPGAYSIVNRADR